MTDTKPGAAKYLTSAEIAEAREWILECSWRDIHDEDDLNELTDREIERGIARHFDGGIDEFRAVCRCNDSASDVGALDLGL